MKSQYQIGAGKAEIQITEEMFPYGFGRGMKFEGIHDPLYVRAILLKNDETTILFVTMDLDSMGYIDWWKDKIRTVLDVSPDHIFVAATHDHNSIHIRNDKDDAPEGDDDTRRSEALVWAAMSEAVLQAANRLQPGCVSYGTGTCDVSINREFYIEGGYGIGRNAHGPSDKTVRVFRFDDMGGRPLAFMINYAVHGNVMTQLDGSVPLLITGDLPGYTSRYVEEYYENQVVALWTSGAAGNQDAKYRGNRILYGSGGKLLHGGYGLDSYALLDVQARDLAEEVISVANTMPAGASEGELMSRQTVCTVPGKDHGRPPASRPKEEPPMKFSGPPPIRPEEDPENPLDLESETDEKVSVHVGLLNINGIGLSCYSGEETCELGWMIQRALREKFEDVVVVSHCNGYIGYMADTVGFERRVRSALVSLIAKGYAEKVAISTPMALAREMGR